MTTPSGRGRGHYHRRWVAVLADVVALVVVVVVVAVHAFEVAFLAGRFYHRGFDPISQFYLWLINVIVFLTSSERF